MSDQIHPIFYISREPCFILLAWQVEIGKSSQIRRLVGSLVPATGDIYLRLP